MFGSWRKVAISLGDGEGGFGNVKGTAFMRDVNDPCLRADPQNDALHDAGVMIAEAEISGESNDGVLFGSRWHLDVILLELDTL